MDKGYKFYSDSTGDLMIRILKPGPGTFEEYRHWKAKTSAINAGQIKLPTRVTDPTTLQWLAERVGTEASIQASVASWNVSYLLRTNNNPLTPDLPDLP